MFRFFSVLVLFALVNSILLEFISLFIYFIGKDVCEETTFLDDPRKGDVTWSDTAVGRRRSVRCAYAYTQPVYVRRDCILVDDDNSSEARWSSWSADDMNICPDPPFSRHVQQLFNQLVLILYADIVYQYLYLNFWRACRTSKQIKVQIVPYSI